MSRATDRAWKRALVGTALGSLLALLGCATIMHQTTQEVGISSTPTKAKVTVDSQVQGETPVVVELKRKNSHIVRLELEGYEPFEATFTRKVSGWVWGNLLFGGLIGLAVDAMSGGLYKLSPEQLAAELKASAAKVSQVDGKLLIIVTMKPKSSWEQVAQLRRADW